MRATDRDSEVVVIGAGLAGSEAAYQLARAGVRVELHEMRPARMTKAHKSGRCAELVCSNSFRGEALENAVGLLKAELREMGSLVMEAADATRVPAGGAHAVDRDLFSAYVDERLRSTPGVEFVTGEVTEIPEPRADRPVIIATGPLTAPALAKEIERLLGGAHLAFFDAISPIIHASSIDFEPLFKASRYGKGDGADYWNIPLDRERYEAFVRDVAAGEKYGGKEEVESDQIENLRPFEGCMPIEEMVARGPETLRFGPMKPVGLDDPRTGRYPHAVIQLRQDNREGTLWSMVGFQTRLKQGEQLRIFRGLPGLASAEFVRLGSVHRNTFIESPKCLGPSMEMRTMPGLFFAGQVTGVEGYVESTAGGLVASLNALARLRESAPVIFPSTTAIGALVHYVSDPSRTHFQPMNVSFGLMPGYEGSGEGGAGARRKGSKKDHRLGIAERSLASVRDLRRKWETANGMGNAGSVSSSEEHPGVVSR